MEEPLVLRAGGQGAPTVPAHGSVDSIDQPRRSGGAVTRQRYRSNPSEPRGMRDLR